MKTTFRSFTLSLVCCVATFGITGCQRDNKSVQAASEPTKAAPAPVPKSTSNNPPGTDVNNVLGGADRSFIMQAEKDSIQDRYLGRMAEEKSQNNDVRAFGRLLSLDSNAALDQLVGIMEKYGISQPKTLPEERKDAFKEIKGLSGPAFDREYLDLMVQGHEKAIAVFQQQATVVQNKDLKKYIEDQIQVLQTRLSKAKELQSKIESSSRNNKD
jgi:putative membrane protein